MLIQFLRFIVVGGVAATAYLVIVIAILEGIGFVSDDSLSPASKVAVNLGGLLVAALVAYGGLRRWTFGSARLHREALPRFIVLSLGGVVLNELLFMALLRLTSLSYQLALAIVLCAVAGLVFFAARLWVFAGR